MSRPRVRLAGGAIAGALLWLLVVPLAARGATGEISGIVRDDLGALLPGVRVSLAGGSAPEASRRTDATGSYRFTAVAPGTFDLSFGLEGFVPEERSGVRVAADQAVVVNATLRASRRYTLALTVDSGSAGVITNQAAVVASTPEGNPGDESAEEDTTVTTRADLSITKSDSVDPVIAGRMLTYTVTVTNSGPSDARFVEVSDTLPAGVTFGSTSGCAEDPGGVATCTLGTIPAGASRQYTITAAVRSSTLGGITNQASVSSQTTEANPGNESTSEDTAVDTRADLSITASDSADPAIAGTPLVYAVTVSNRGPSDAREVAVAAALPEAAVLDSTSGCEEDPGGIPTCSLGTIPAGGSKQFTVALRVDSAATAGISIQASASSRTTEASPGDESTAESTAVEAHADLVLAASDSADPVIAGTPLAFTVTVSNKGPSDARDVVVSNSLPAGVAFGSTTGCAEDPGGDRTCTLGTIAAGSSKQFSVALTVDSAITDDLTFRTSVSQQTTEAGPGEESVTESTAIDTRADLVLTSRDSVDPVVAGLPLVYTVAVSNNGPSDARDVAVASVLPEGVSFRSTTGCAEDGSPGGGVPTCTLGTIVAGSAKRYTIALRVNPDATGTITNRARVSSSTAEDRPGDEAIPEQPVEGGAPEGELVDLALAWARAWSEQRLEDYLGFYAGQYRPPRGLSSRAWGEGRIEGRQWIQVRLSAIETELLGPERARVSFDQAYRSDTYSDQVYKTLELVREDGQWKILEERAR